MLDSWLRRFSALFDKSAWLLIAPSFAALYFIDAPSAVTLLQWSLFALVIAGFAVVISRIVFPQIKLTSWLKEAGKGNEAAARVVAAVILFVGALIIALAIWAKP